jgi:hypothetical protein
MDTKKRIPMDLSTVSMIALLLMLLIVVIFEKNPKDNSGNTESIKYESRYADSDIPM